MGIEVIDPQSEVVERGVSVVTADNTFTYSFVAGEQQEFALDEPMVTSGNYRMVVTYFPPGDPLDVEQLDLVFEYNVIIDAAKSGSSGNRHQPTSSLFRIQRPFKAQMMASAYRFQKAG